MPLSEQDIVNNHTEKDIQTQLRTSAHVQAKYSSLSVLLQKSQGVGVRSTCLIHIFFKTKLNRVVFVSMLLYCSLRAAATKQKKQSSTNEAVKWDAFTHMDIFYKPINLFPANNTEFSCKTDTISFSWQFSLWVNQKLVYWLHRWPLIHCCFDLHSESEYKILWNIELFWPAQMTMVLLKGCSLIFQEMKWVLGCFTFFLRCFS